MLIKLFNPDFLKVIPFAVKKHATCSWYILYQLLWIKGKLRLSIFPSNF